MRIRQNRIGKALAPVAPNYHQRRRTTTVVAIYGLSRFIVAGTTMSVKNNVMIFKNICRSIMTKILTY